MKSFHASVGVLVLTLFWAVPSASGQSRLTSCDPKLGLVKMKPCVFLKNRMQDVPDIRAVKRILYLRERAIPSLIECLTDGRKTKEPVFDFWAETRVGDIAFVLLLDLFPDAKMKHLTVDGVITWQENNAESTADSPSWVAWDQYLANHGRLFIQQAWLKNWAEIENRVYRDASERRFKVKSG